ncbi:unnamed protein product [Meganyctiphanes norvegica]|uniref:CUB domain-containing protein n=1 Tax=Meganyctiphanes norvegica TaxID=48144 RepID=A0AAV2RQT7_MEGNR
MRLDGAMLVVAAAVLGLAAAHFPGSFHNIMMMIGKKDGTQRLSWKGPTKMARIAPSPPRMWAVIDPPGSLGSLSDESIHTNRIARSLKSIDETVENEESQYGARFVRSISNRREARQVDEDVTEAPEEVTEAPDEVTEAPVDITEEPVEDITEPPTPAPVVCGGDLTMDLDPNNIEADADGRILHKSVLSPGYEDGEYPDQGFECEWIIGVGSECQMGMLMFAIEEGEIRETSRCEEDHLAVSYRGKQETKFCGMLRKGQHQVTGTDLWTSATDMEMRVTFRAVERSSSYLRSAGKPVGFNMTISCYCWVWNPSFLARKTPITTTTTTEAPADDPVTSISEDGEGYEEEVTEAEDIVTAAPQENGFDESGERFSDVANDLESINDISDSLVPELSSATSVETYSSIASLISDLSPQEGSNNIDLETPDIDLLNTEALNPIVSEAGLLPSITDESKPDQIIPGNLISTIQSDESIFNTNYSSISTISSIGSTDSIVSETEMPLPVDTKPVPVDSNTQVSKPIPNNSNKQTGANKPNKKPNKNKTKPTKPPTTFIPFIPLRDDSNLMESDTPYIGEKINFEPIINQLLAQ